MEGIRDYQSRLNERSRTNRRDLFRDLWPGIVFDDWGADEASLKSTEQVVGLGLSCTGGHYCSQVGFLHRILDSALKAFQLI